MYIVKTQLYSLFMFTNTKARLHVSALNVDHLQVVQEET